MGEEEWLNRTPPCGRIETLNLLQHPTLTNKPISKEGPTGATMIWLITLKAYKGQPE